MRQGWKVLAAGAVLVLGSLEAAATTITADADRPGASSDLVVVQGPAPSGGGVDSAPGAESARPAIAPEPETLL
jgi:hypothetical protein